jgi:molybdenum cofactor cytidylyltransferase
VETNRKKIACLVLAAGSSVRFGSPKQLADLAGKSLIQIAIDEANSSSADYVFVVLGNSSSEILENLRLENTQVVFNKDFKQGIASSIKCGVSNIPDDCAGMIIMVADQPFLRSRHLNMLIEAFKKSPGKIVALSSNGEPRNPVLLPIEMTPELEKLQGDEGAKTLVNRDPNTILLEIPDPRIFFDVDTKDSLVELGKGHESLSEASKNCDPGEKSNGSQ